MRAVRPGDAELTTVRAIGIAVVMPTAYRRIRRGKIARSRVRIIPRAQACGSRALARGDSAGMFPKHDGWAPDRTATSPRPAAREPLRHAQTATATSW